ncbi:MAG: glycosyltransferase [Vicinamibacterales bacterium]
MQISVIIPAYQSRGSLPRCLAALRASTLLPADVVVVDDGSTDGTGELAGAAGATVVPVPAGPLGPAAARNRGAAHAGGDILLFLDADVAVHADALARIADCFRDHAEVAALFGSYDDEPTERTLVSRYRNLLHHHVHQHGREDASAFWAGCGAVRRAVFEAVGGFDERFTHPSIEDIEFGSRLRDGGHRIWMRPEIQATHLKRWTLRSVLRSDIFDRAIPWSRLIVRRGALPDDLNTATSGRVSAAASWVLVAAGGLGLATRDGRWAFVALTAFAVLQVVNRSLYRLLLRKGGLPLLGAGVALHLVYFLYSSAVFAAIAGTHLLRRTGAGA